MIDRITLFLDQLFCRHSWTPWITVFKGRILGYNTDDQVGAYSLQSKYCVKCQKVKNEYFEE